MNLHDHCIAGLSFDARPPNARQQPVLKASSFKFNMVPKQIFVAQHHGIVTEWTDDRGVLLWLSGGTPDLFVHSHLRLQFARKTIWCARVSICV
jgi:hypothetical protein